MAERPRTTSTPPPGVTAVVLGRTAGVGLVRTLIDRLAATGVAVSIVDTLDEARAILRRLGPATPVCVLIDADAAPGETSDGTPALPAWVAAATQLAPGLAPIVVARTLPAEMAIACFRAGAGDVLELEVEGVAAGRPSVARVVARQARTVQAAAQVATLRGMIEEFLRELIRAERRSIDLEEQLHHRARRATGEFLAAVDPEPARPPAILLAEDDRQVADRLAEELEAAGVTTYAYLSGEQAVAEARQLAAAGVAFDLALIDLRLPGMDGLATIRALRAAHPGLAAFLMTGYDDTTAAADAADLGVVGYVYKPFDDLPLLIQRLRELATGAMQRAREQRYLRQIKERHERVLSQYRALPPLDE